MYGGGCLFRFFRLDLNSAAIRITILFTFKKHPSHIKCCLIKGSLRSPLAASGGDLSDLNSTPYFWDSRDVLLCVNETFALYIQKQNPCGL